MIEHLGGCRGNGFLIELAFLKGREKLASTGFRPLFFEVIGLA
jgi:hypothetical protein